MSWSLVCGKGLHHHSRDSQRNDSVPQYFVCSWSSGEDEEREGNVVVFMTTEWNVHTKDNHGQTHHYRGGDVTSNYLCGDWLETSVTDTDRVTGV